MSRKLLNEHKVRAKEMGWIATSHSRGKNKSTQAPSQISIISNSYKIPQKLSIPFKYKNLVYGHILDEL